MVNNVRTQNRYERRLRELIETTQDVKYAFQRDLPRSTARRRLNTPGVEIVNVDSLDIDATPLQREILRLQGRNRKLVALMRVLVVILRSSRFKLNQARLSGDKDKDKKVNNNVQSYISNSQNTENLGRPNLYRVSAFIECST